MTVHYQNRHGDMVFISGVIHLQNAENGIFGALMPDGSELTLLVDRIEGIYYQDREKKNENTDQKKRLLRMRALRVFRRGWIYV